MRYWLALILLTVSVASAAQTMYRWVDKQGGVHYTDHPPAPGKAARVEEKHTVTLGVPTTTLSAQLVANYPVTLYTQTTCGEPCQSGRDLLKRRGVPFTEKSIETEEDAKALSALVGGTDKLNVPVIKVGSQIAQGYLASKWNGLLDDAGYPKAPEKP